MIGIQQKPCFFGHLNDQVGHQILLSEDGTSAQRATYTQSAWDAGLVFGDAPLPPREVRAPKGEHEIWGFVKYMKLKKMWS